jgi:hypothetical protein
MSNRWGEFKAEAGNAALVAGYILIHTIICSIIICCMWGLEHLILLLWSGREPSLGGVQLHTVILTGELVVLVVFLAGAIISVAKVLWRQ